MSILILSMSFLIFIYNKIMFNLRLKELRKEKGLKQKEIANILQCSQSMIARWESGECEPTENVIRRAALYFNVSSDYLIGLEDESGRKIYINNSFNNNNNFNNNNVNIRI